MIQRCKYLVRCDNDCGTYPIPLMKKAEIKDRGIITYRWHKVNPISDEMFLVENPDAVMDLHFCCQRCADEYFEYYKNSRPHYTKIEKI